MLYNYSYFQPLPSNQLALTGTGRTGERIVAQSQTQSEYVETHRRVYHAEKEMPLPPRKW